MNFFDYSNIDVDIPTFEYELLLAGQTLGGICYDANTSKLKVYTDLDQVTTNGVVAGHDPNSLFAKKVQKAEEFDRTTSLLVANGVFYGGVVMGVAADSKTLYTSVASDDDNAGVTVTYPIQFPALTGSSLEVTQRSELDTLINTVNDRLIYLYEDQENADGSYGLIGYSKQIFSPFTDTQEKLDAIVDTRI